MKTDPKFFLRKKCHAENLLRLYKQKGKKEKKTK